MHRITDNNYYFGLLLKLCYIHHNYIFWYGITKQQLCLPLNDSWKKLLCHAGSPEDVWPILSSLKLSELRGLMYVVFDKLWPNPHSVYKSSLHLYIHIGTHSNHCVVFLHPVKRNVYFTFDDPNECAWGVWIPTATQELACHVYWCKTRPSIL